MKNIRDEVKNLFENDDNEKSDKKDEDLELLLDDEQLAEGDSSVEEDNLFDKCQKSCDDSYEKCDASCEGNVECENDCMDVYNQCGANCEDLDNIEEAVDKALREAKDPKAPRIMNIKWRRGGVLGPRASKIPEDIFKEFIDQGRDDSVILSWLSKKFRGIPVSFEWTTFKGSPIKEQRDEYGSVVFGEWKDSGEPDINDIDDEKTRAREDDDSKMEHHDEEPTEISKEEFDQKAKSGKQIGRASERGHILTPCGDVVFHDGPTFLTNDRELVFYDDWSKKYYKIENFGDNLEELERKTDEYYEKEKEKRGFEDDEYYDDVAPYPEERRYDDVDEDNGEDIDEGKNMTRNLKTEVKKLFEVNDSESEKKDPKKYPFSLQVMRNHKWVDHLYFKTEKEANDKKDEYLEDPHNRQADPERYRVKERTIKEDVEVNIPQRGDFAIAELSPQEKQEIVWTFAGECADVVEKMIESNVSIRGVYGYEVPRKAEVMHAKLFDFILAEIEKA